MTTSQVGNYGTNSEDLESSTPKVQGFVIKECSPHFSNWRSEGSLSQYLEKHEIPGLEGIDTRALTKKLRSVGAMKCCLSTQDIDQQQAVALAQQWGGLEGVDYVKDVSSHISYQWDADGKDSMPFAIEGTNLTSHSARDKTFKVAAYDFGAKLSIFRKLGSMDLMYTFPADSPRAVREIQ